MFIYNIKINGTKVFKIIFSGIVVLVIALLCICVFKIFDGAKQNFTISDELNNGDIFEISPQNYSNVLKAVHDNIDNYVGMKIKFTGYVYRINDTGENQFILARNMLTATNSKEYVVVGFLCECNNAKSFATNTWVEAIGEIQKGSYHGNDMPILAISNIVNTQKPSEDFIAPPSENYIPTSSVL